MLHFRTNLGQFKSNLEEDELASYTKLTPFQTYITLLKGFIATGILYLPTEVQAGGYAFSALGLFLSFIFTTLCMFKLMEAKNKTNCRSYKDVGKKAYGSKGRAMVEVFLVLT